MTESTSGADHQSSAQEHALATARRQVALVRDEKRNLDRQLATAGDQNQKLRTALESARGQIEQLKKFLANEVEVQVRTGDGETWFEVTMADAWVWDVYRPARFIKKARVITFKDVNIEELPANPDLSLPPDGPGGPFGR